MSTDRDTTRIVRSWLQTDEYESADRVLDAVLDQLDTTPQRRSTWWPARRLPHMNTTASWPCAPRPSWSPRPWDQTPATRQRTSVRGPTPTLDPVPAFAADRRPPAIDTLSGDPASGVRSSAPRSQR